MKNILTLTMMSIFLAFTACSNDDDNTSNNGSNGNGSGNGSINTNTMSFTITGAVEGEKTGFSYITIVGDSSYSISSNDGTSIDDQTFSLAFNKNFQDNSTSNPSPGTYPIGTVVDLTDEDGFWVFYDDIQNNKGYGSGTSDVSGTLTITSNSNNQLKGTFEFTATSNETGESITVTNGKFSAAID